MEYFDLNGICQCCCLIQLICCEFVYYLLNVLVLMRANRCLAEYGSSHEPHTKFYVVDKNNMTGKHTHPRGDPHTQIFDDLQQNIWRFLWEIGKKEEGI
jgi:hypothetical protein